MGTYTGRNPMSDIMGTIDMMQEDWNMTQCYQGFNQEEHTGILH